MASSPLIDALRDDLAVLQDIGVIDMVLLPAFDAAMRRGVPAGCRIADTAIDVIQHGVENPR
jgi:hypothetical protein